MTDYSGYDALAFAADESFQEWVWRGAEDQYWQQVVSANPGLRKEIEDARKALSSIRFKENWPPKELIEKSLADAFVKIAAKQKNAKVVPLYRWWAAAAAILVLLTSAYFLWSSSEKDHATPIAKSSKVNDIAPGGNKAILTLADGTKVILDSANNGTITKQGNVTIIKLNDGQLAYKPSTLNPQSSTTDRLSTVLYNTISTPRGGQYQLVLADGSKVWLNAASSIRFPNAFPGNDRKVEITGEAYFEVAHNAAKPFYVEAGGMEVKVLGTHFNVNAYTDEPSVRTTLLQGSVQVVNGSHSKIIVPGEQAQVGSNGDINTSQVDVNEVVAWKNGKFIFDNANIHSIMRQLEKWYDIDVVYQATDTNETFMGSISRDVNCSQILDMLEKTGSLKFEIVGRRVIVK